MSKSTITSSSDNTSSFQKQQQQSRYLSRHDSVFYFLVSIFALVDTLNSPLHQQKIITYKEIMVRSGILLTGAALIGCATAFAPPKIGSGA